MVRAIIVEATIQLERKNQRGGSKSELCTTTVVFVPITTGGLLQRMLIKMEETMSKISASGSSTIRLVHGSKLMKTFNQDLG